MSVNGLACGSVSSMAHGCTATCTPPSAVVALRSSPPPLKWMIDPNRAGVAVPATMLAPVSAATSTLFGSLEQIRGRAELHDGAVVEHADPVGQDRRVVEGVGDQQGGQPEIAQRVAQLVAHLLASYRVERAERLVEQEHARLPGQRAGQRHPLALAARKLHGQHPGQVSDAQALEQVGAFASARERHVGGDREVWEQPVVLGQVANPPALRAEVDASLAVEPHLVAQRDATRSAAAPDRPASAAARSYRSRTDRRARSSRRRGSGRHEDRTIGGGG